MRVADKKTWDNKMGQYYGWVATGYSEKTEKWWAMFWNDGRIMETEMFDSKDEMNNFVFTENEKRRHVTEW